MHLSEINIYPIKSLRCVSLENAKVEKRGLQLDRRWMLVDETDVFFTQREFPQLATISVRLNENHLEINENSRENLKIPFEFEPENETKVRVWKSVCDALVLPDYVNEWFSDFLQKKCRLVYMPDETEREISALFNQGSEIVSFADGYPFLLIGENSLNDLNERLENPLLMNRFRPNFVIKDSAPFAEDRWKKIKIGNIIFRSTKPCARCVVTTIDQSAGVFDGKEPLKTLANYRLAKDVFPENYSDLDLDKNAVLFGQNFVAENFEEIIEINDEVEVLETS